MKGWMPANYMPCHLEEWRSTDISDHPKEVEQKNMFETNSQTPWNQWAMVHFAQLSPCFQGSELRYGYGSIPILIPFLMG
jgi:hypothetical protein